MGGLIARLLINAIALMVAVYFVPGIQGPSFRNVDGIIQYIPLALIFGLVNALIRPVLQFLSCPLVVLTLGLFTFVINAVMLWLTSAIAQYFDLNFRVLGFWPALFGSIIISVVSIVLTTIVSDD